MAVSLAVAFDAAAQVTGDLPAPPVTTGPGPVIEVGPRPSSLPKVADARTWEVFRQACSSPLGRRELSLFLDGTIRLRVTDKEGNEVRLGSLETPALSRIYGRLQASLAGVGREAKLWSQPPRDRGVDGEFLQECELVLNLPDAAAQHFRFSPIEFTPLWLGQLRQLADDLAARTEPLAHGLLPKNYEPHHGDILRRRDGALFRFVGITSDKKAWMLEQVGQPTTTYYSVADLDEIFVELVASQLRTSEVPNPR